MISFVGVAVFRYITKLNVFYMVANVNRSTPMHILRWWSLLHHLVVGWGCEEGRGSSDVLVFEFANSRLGASSRGRGDKD